MRALAAPEHRGPLVLSGLLLLMQELHGRQVLERFINSADVAFLGSHGGLGLGRYAVLAASQLFGEGCCCVRAGA